MAVTPSTLIRGRFETCPYDKVVVKKLAKSVILSEAKDLSLYNYLETLGFFVRTDSE